MRKSMLVLLCGLAVTMASPVAAQTGAGAGAARGSGSGSGAGSSGEQSTSTSTTSSTSQGTGRSTATATATRAEDNRWVRTLTNVQIELTLSDQTGTETPEKKTVQMIVSSGNWGKIRSAGNARPSTDLPVPVDLNIDARPLVSVDNQIQLELTLVYRPPGIAKDAARAAAIGLNQSLTVILQSGKPLVISQAADPIGDRKVIVEVKATILK